MPEPLFRPSALQKLSSPEQLDELMPITRPQAWIALSAIGVLLAAALLWSVFGSLPTTVVGQGIIVRQGGLFSVVSYGDGIVTETANLLPDSKVSKGQVIARIAQPALQLQVAAAKADLERLQIEQKTVAQRLTVEQPVQSHARKLERQIQESTAKAREEQLRSLQRVERQQAELLRDGLITRQRYEETHQAILATENDIRNAGSALQRLAMVELTDGSSREERQRDIDSRVTQAQNRFSELQLQLQLASAITSPLDGVVVEVMVKRGGTVKAGQPIVLGKFETHEHQAMVFLPPHSNAELIKPGMAAQISPVTAKKERYGYILGNAVRVARYPASDQGIMALFNNEALVREVTKQGPPIEVQVALLHDPATRSGFKWSSNAGAAMEVHSGTACTVNIVVERNRPISLIIPLLKATVGL